MSANDSLRLGLIGLDTSHVEMFAATFNDPTNPHFIPGARITTAFPGGSVDFPLSIDRMPRYTEKLRTIHGIDMVESPDAVAERVDAVLLTSVDGRVHLRQFGEIAPRRRPTFVDKPLATTSAEAKAIAALAREHGVPMFSASSLRFAAELQAELRREGAAPVIGADFAGPMAMQSTQPGYFWYGVHTVEMVFATLGGGCESVRAFSTAHHEVIVGRWRDGRMGVVRGNRCGNGAFTGAVHREDGSRPVNSAAGMPAYQGLARAVHAFFRGAPAPVAMEETLEIIRFLEAANESAARGGVEVRL